MQIFQSFLAALITFIFAGAAMAHESSSPGLCAIQADAKNVAVAVADIDEDSRIALLAMIESEEMACLAGEPITDEVLDCAISEAVCASASGNY